MSEQNNDNLKNRVTRLEQRVEQLEHRLETQTSDSKSPAKEKVVEDKSGDGRFSSIHFGEEWLNRIGIALLLIGIAFLFKYSIDQGWLIPQIRSAIGLIAGTALLGFGLRISSEIKLLKQILLGGGIGAFYITGFATFQLFSFMPSAVIWVFMILVTLLSLFLSLQQDEALLSVVGTLGALGTPFMLYSGEGDVTALVLYIALILSATSIMYIQKGWKALLWSMAVGGMLVLFAAIVNNIVSTTEIAVAEQWIMQAGVIIWGFACWLVPVYREVRLAESTRYSQNSGNDNSATSKGYRMGSTIHLMVLGVPIIGLILSMGICELTMNQTGMASMGLAALGGGLYPLLKRWDLKSLASTHAFLGLLMATGGLFLLLEGDFLFAVVIVEILALRYVGYQIKDQKISICSHILFGIAVLWLFNRLQFSEPVSPFLVNMTALPELVLILAGGLWIPRYLRDADWRNIYQIVSHILLLIWMYQKLVPFEHGQAWITIAWGAYAITLLALGFVRFGSRVRLVGLATILVVVAKLFLVDLSQLQAIWRILLFMGFGTILLILGYFTQSKWLEKRNEA